MFSVFDIYPVRLFASLLTRVPISRGKTGTKILPDKKEKDNGDLILTPIINVLGSFKPHEIRSFLYEVDFYENMPKQPAQTFLTTISPVVDFFKRLFPTVRQRYWKEQFYDQIVHNSCPFLSRASLSDKQFELLCSDKDISGDWKLFLLGQRITSVMSDSQSINVENLKTYVRDMLPTALLYVNKKGNDENLTRDFYNNFIGTDEIKIRLRAYYIAGLLARFEDHIKRDAPLGLLFALMKKSTQDMRLKIEERITNNGNSDFLIEIDSLNPPSSYELFGTVFHEIEHNIIKDGYNLSPVGIHRSSIHEFVCDLSSIVNCSKYISDDIDKMKAEFNKLKYKKHLEETYLFCNDFAAEEHIIARAFLQSIIDYCEEHPAQIPLKDVIKGLHDASHKVLARHLEKKDFNNLSFIDFSEEVIEEANLTFLEKGFQFKVSVSDKPLSLELLTDEVELITANEYLAQKKLVYMMKSGVHITKVPYATVEFV